MSQTTIKYYFHYYPFRELQWECRIGIDSFIDPNSLLVATAVTKEEARQRALDTFKNAFYQEIIEVDDDFEFEAPIELQSPHI